MRSIGISTEYIRQNLFDIQKLVNIYFWFILFCKIYGNLCQLLISGSWIKNKSIDSSNNFAIKNVLLGVVNLTRNAFISYGSELAFVWADLWSFGNELAPNIVVFDVNSSSQRYSENQFLTLAEGPPDDMINSVFKPEKKVYY